MCHGYTRHHPGSGRLFQCPKKVGVLSHSAVTAALESELFTADRKTNLVWTFFWQSASSAAEVITSSLPVTEEGEAQGFILQRRTRTAFRATRVCGLRIRQLCRHVGESSRLNQEGATQGAF